MDRYQKFIQEKAKKKRKLFGATFFPRTPVLLIDPSHMQDSIALMPEILNAVSEIELPTVVISDGAEPSHRNKLVKFLSPQDASDAVGAADFALVFNGDAESMRGKGCVPIAPKDGNGTVDYNPLQEEGNGFYFKTPTKWEVFAAIVRAKETYQFPYDWENLVKEILKRES